MKLCITFLLMTQLSIAQKIDLKAIATIESSNNPDAWNKTDGGSRGLYQISPIGLKDYNNNNQTKYRLKDLFNSAINKKIAMWFFNVRIPYLLRAYSIPVTTDNKIIAYNAGIRYLRYEIPIPKSTKAYLAKYKELTNSRPTEKSK